MDTNDFAQKDTSKFDCLLCDFNTSNKTHFNRHLETKKHKQRSILTNTNDLTQKNTLYVCECGKSYKHKPSLYNHKKKCVYKEKQMTVIEEKEKIEENINYKEIINELINQNNLLQNTIKDLIPKIGNNTINSNNKFNLNIFLNETCRDAISMDEFINKVQVSLSNLFYTKEKGIAEGVSNIFIENLNRLPLTQRPIHCTDVKRETIYIKNKEWEKDEKKEKTKEAIKKVSTIQVKNINKFKDAHPNFMQNEKEKDDYISIVRVTTSDIDDKQEKIIKNICKEVYVNDGLIMK